MRISSTNPSFPSKHNKGGGFAMWHTESRSYLTRAHISRAEGGGGGAGTLDSRVLGRFDGGVFFIFPNNIYLSTEE